jgi:lipoyl(octanoyl) transferase
MPNDVSHHDETPLMDDAGFFGHAQPSLSALEAYMLKTVPFEEYLLFQRRMVYEVASEPSRVILVMCDHPAGITIGRQGSRAHIHYDNEELRRRRWPVRWVGRGGGCLFHAPGQLSIYPILSLERFGLSVGGYLDRLHKMLVAVADDYFIAAKVVVGRTGVWVGDRLLGHVGVNVRGGVTSFGLTLNLGMDLEPFRKIRCAGGDAPMMTSLERERRGGIRPGAVRERVLERFAEQFPVSRVTVFHDHPELSRASTNHAAIAASS